MFKSNLKISRYLLIAALIMLSLVSIANAASVGSPLTFSGETMTSDTNIQSDYFTNSCVFGIWGTPIYSDSFTFQAPTTGSYTFPVTAGGGNIGWTGIFLDGYSQPNCVGSGMNSSTVTLTAGETYVLVVWLCDSSCIGPAVGTYTVNSTVPPTAEEPAASAPSTDNDGDGIPNDRDNCANDYNPGQEDGWGSGMGDACDTEWYNRVGDGVAGFVQKSGMLNVHGNCAYLADGAPRCPEIAILDPSTFTPDAMPMNAVTVNAGTWSVVVHYLHSNDGDVYQVNIYSTNPPQPDTLVDDRMEIHVHGGAWKWYQRGGDLRYGGLLDGIYSGS